eukprot:5651110-Amphidinium_carterae.1
MKALCAGRPNSAISLGLNKKLTCPNREFEFLGGYSDTPDYCHWHIPFTQQMTDTITYTAPPNPTPKMIPCTLVWLLGGVSENYRFERMGPLEPK